MARKRARHPLPDIQDKGNDRETVADDSQLRAAFKSLR
jgi:hypothetical protein